MNRQDSFNAAVATFEKLLRMTKSHQIYFKEWEETKMYTGTANVFYAWREWAKSTNPIYWISDAFVWIDSEKGYDYWHIIHDVWSDLCERDIIY